MSGLRLKELDANAVVDEDLLSLFQHCREHVQAIAAHHLVHDYVGVTTRQGFVELIDTRSGEFRLFLTHLDQLPLDVSLRCFSLVPAYSAFASRSSGLYGIAGSGVGGGGSAAAVAERSGPFLAFSLAYSNELLLTSFASSGRGTSGGRTHVAGNAVRRIGVFRARPCALYCDGEYIVCGDGGGHVAVWRATVAPAAALPAPHLGDISTADIVDLADPTELWHQAICSDSVEALRVHRDTLICSSADFQCTVASIYTGAILSHIRVGVPEAVVAVLPTTAPSAGAAGVSMAVCSATRIAVYAAGGLSTRGAHSAAALSGVEGGEGLPSVWERKEAVDLSAEISCASYSGGYLAAGTPSGEVMLFHCDAATGVVEEYVRFDVGHGVVGLQLYPSETLIVVTTAGDVWRWPLADLLAEDDDGEEIREEGVISGPAPEDQDGDPTPQTSYPLPMSPPSPQFQGGDASTQPGDGETAAYSDLDSSTEDARGVEGVTGGAIHTAADGACQSARRVGDDGILTEEGRGSVRTDKFVYGTGDSDLHQVSLSSVDTAATEEEEEVTSDVAAPARGHIGGGVSDNEDNVGVPVGNPDTLPSPFQRRHEAASAAEGQRPVLEPFRRTDGDGGSADDRRAVEVPGAVDLHECDPQVMGVGVGGAADDIAEGKVPFPTTLSTESDADASGEPPLLPTHTSDDGNSQRSPRTQRTAYPAAPTSVYPQPVPPPQQPLRREKPVSLDVSARMEAYHARTLASASRLLGPIPGPEVAAALRPLGGKRIMAPAKIEDILSNKEVNHTGVDGQQQLTQPHSTAMLLAQRDALESETFDHAAYALEHPLEAAALPFRHPVKAVHYAPEERVFSAVTGGLNDASPRLQDRQNTDGDDSAGHVLLQGAARESVGAMHTAALRGEPVSLARGRGGCAVDDARTNNVKDDLMDVTYGRLGRNRRVDPQWDAERLLAGPNIDDHPCDELVYCAPDPSRAVLFTEYQLNPTPLQPLLPPMPLPPTPPAF